MASSLLPLKIKIISGYVTLILLFVILILLTCKENIRLSDTDKYTKCALTQQEEAEAITVQILDIALLSEKAVVWSEKDIAIYKGKQEKVITSLKRLQQQLADGSQRNRISSILTLLSAKEKQTSSIVLDFRELQNTHKQLNDRVPHIIQQTKQDKQSLADKIANNYTKSEKENRGFLGLFRNKKKRQIQTQKENEVILKENQTSSDSMFRQLEKEMRQLHQKKNESLLLHMDSLSRQNTYLDREINRLISEFSHITRIQVKEKADIYLRGQEKTLQLVSGLGIFATLLAIIFYFILQRDLTKRHSCRVLLEQLNRSNEQLLRSRKNMMLTVSHDLRVPLTAIHGCTELLMDERLKEKRNQLCTTILQSSESMTALLNTMLNFQRLDAGKELPEFKPFQLKNLVTILEAEFRSLACKAGLVFNVEYCGENIVVTGDRERLHQIVGNLLSNAIKFTHSGEVRLKLLYGEGILTIIVSDTGSGMTEEQIKRIFQPFERLENAENQEGFGLGLSITQGLVGLLNGRIEVQSEYEKGSRFTVLIPLPVTEDQQLTQEVTSTPSLPRGLRILAIDDDPVLLMMTRDMLIRHQVQCDTCKNLQELTEQMRKHKYDLIITDICMPQITGFQLLELLRSSDIGTSRTIPVLAVTARADSKETDFTDVGFADCLYKPFSITELLTSVQRCVVVPQEQPELQADFSRLLSDEHNGKEMLELVIQETEKDLMLLLKSMKKEDCETIFQIVHRLLPLWEIIRMDAPLKDLYQMLEQEGCTKDEKFQNIVNRVIDTGKLLKIQAAAKIQEREYE